MNFGENLKTLRKNAKLSQEVLADKVGVTRQAVSRWEVGDAYPEMSNIVALCSIFKCNINDLINDNTLDIKSFDKKTQEGIVKFKKEQQKKMKGISKAIYILTNITKYILLVPAICLALCSLIFPFVSNTFEITDNKVKVLNIDFDYSIDGNILTYNNQEHYIETSSNIKEFIKSHDKQFFVNSIEYILLCETSSLVLIVFMLHYIYKLYKNIYKGNTPFTLDNEKLVKKACMLFFIELILQKITALIYSLIVNLDLAIEFNVKDVIAILIAISVVYIFKYGRMIQADSEAKIYD